MVSSDKVEDWFFLDEQGAQNGPHLREELMRRWRTGQLTGETLVWTPGMEQWTAFRAMFPTLTPPPPPERISIPPVQARTPDASPSLEVQSDKPKRNWLVFVAIAFASVLLRFFIDNVYRYGFYVPGMISNTEVAEAIGFALLPLVIAAVVFHRVGATAAALTAFLIIGSVSLAGVQSEKDRASGSAHAGAAAVPNPTAPSTAPVTPVQLFVIGERDNAIVCVGPGDSQVRIRLASRVHNGVQLNCIDGDFVQDSSGCAPQGAFALHAPTGSGAIGELVDRLSADLPHTGIAIGNSRLGEHIDFNASYLSGGDGTPPVVSWCFGVNRTTGAGRLMTPGRRADYLCRPE